MTDETAQQKIERLEPEVRNLRLGMGASQAPGLPMTTGEAGIEATAAERDELVEATR